MTKKNTQVFITNIVETRYFLQFFTIFICLINRLCLVLQSDYADEKVIISTSDDPTTASTNLQNHLSLMEHWYTK